MPKPYPREFREDVVAIARRREQPFAQVAKGFGISESCVKNGVHRADIEDGASPGQSRAELDEVRELKKKVRALEQAPFRCSRKIITY